MQLRFRQRVFSWFDTYDITDGIGSTVFKAKGKFSLWGHKMLILNQDGQEVGLLKECRLRFRPQFKVFVRGVYQGKIIKRISLFHPKFKFTFMPWEVHGDLFAFDYQIFNGKMLVATVAKELFHLSDTYLMDVIKPEDALLVLMVVLGIDIAKERKAQRRANH
jgi:uncharacterized protein YxjI